MTTVPDELVALAHRLADAARAETVPRFRTALAVDDKADVGFDPVTLADRSAEAAMRALLQTEVPEHGIVGEEHGTAAGASEWRWILDPVDGTRAFIAGFPTWVTLIGLFRGEEPAYGLIDAPATDDRWAGGLGRPMRPGVRPCADLASAVISTTSAELFRTPGTRAGWQALCARTRLRRYGGDGYAYGLLAAGHLDGIVEFGLQLYDVAAVIPVVRAAGGQITGWDGGSPVRGHVVASGDPRVHDQILEVLRATGAAAEVG